MNQSEMSIWIMKNLKEPLKTSKIVDGDHVCSEIFEGFIIVFKFMNRFPDSHSKRFQVTQSISNICLSSIKFFPFKTSKRIKLFSCSDYDLHIYRHIKHHIILKRFFFSLFWRLIIVVHCLQCPYI